MPSLDRAIVLRLLSLVNGLPNEVGNGSGLVSQPLRQDNVFKSLPFGGVTTKQGYGGLVGIASSVALTVIQTIHPDWLGNHPWMVPAALVFLGVSLLLFFAQYRWFQRLLGVAHPHVDTAETAGSSARSESSPSYKDSFNPKNEVNLTINGLPSAPLPSSTEAAPLENPNVEIRGINAASVEWDRALWTLRPGKDMGILAGVFNTPDPENKRPNLHAQSVIATIDFLDEQKELVHSVSRAFWCGHTENEIYLPIAEHAAALVGVWKNDDLFAFTSQQRVKLRLAFGTTRIIKSPIWKQIRVKDFVDIKLLVISIATNSVLDSATFRILRQRQGFEIVGG